MTIKLIEEKQQKMKVKQRNATVIGNFISNSVISQIDEKKSVPKN